MVLEGGQEGHLCDRCREVFPFDELEQVTVPGYNALCSMCWTIVKAIQSGAVR